MARRTIAGLLTIGSYYLLLWVIATAIAAALPGAANNHVVLVAEGAAVGAALPLAWYVSQHLDQPQEIWLTSILTGAFITGTIGCLIGIAAPILFSAGGNLAPLNGLFVGAGGGFIVGAIASDVRWRRRHPQARAS